MVTMPTCLEEETPIVAATLGTRALCVWDGDRQRGHRLRNEPALDTFTDLPAFIGRASARSYTLVGSLEEKLITPEFCAMDVCWCKKHGDELSTRCKGLEPTVPTMLGEVQRERHWFRISSSRLDWHESWPDAAVANFFRIQ